MGSSTTEVRTGATQATGFYDEMVLVVINSAGSAARAVSAYNNTNGAFTVAALPFTPSSGDRAIVIALDQAASMGGDWTSAEQDQIRGALGVVGVQTTPVGGGDLQAVKAQVDKIDDAATTGPGAATTGSLLDRLANKDGSKTYNQSTDSLEAISDQLSAIASAGSRQVTIHVDDQTASDLPDVTVSIFNDTNTVFLSRGVTDANGDVVFALDDGNYNARLSKAGFTFTVPETFTVTADQTVDLAGVGFTVPPPSAPNLCVIFGTIIDAGGNDVVGACVQAFATTPQDVAGTTLGEPLAEVTTDQAGAFTIELVRNSEVRFTIEDAGVDFVKTVPDLASQDFTTWP